MNVPDHSKVDRTNFWDDKILGWEQDRYDDNNKRSSLLEKIANNASNSLRYRYDLTKKIIGAKCRGKSVVEIGCGTGRLAAPLIKAGVENYRGFDISSVAIDEAKEKAAEAGLSDKVTFAVADIEVLPELNCDVVFSTGLLDWLSNEEIEKLFYKSGSAHCFHSFSESRMALSQLLHRLYVQIAYGYRTGSYVPRYLKASWLGPVAESASGRPVQFIRDPRLSFGAFVTTLTDFDDTE